MVKYESQTKKHAFTFLELILALTLLLVILSPLSLSSQKLLKKWRYQCDVNKLKSQLQQAYTLVLHCNIPVNVQFIESKKGVYCHLDLQNLSLSQKVKSRCFYPNIKKVKLNNTPTSQPNLTFSELGDYAHPVQLSLYGEKIPFYYSMAIKGYPHVLEAKKN